MTIPRIAISASRPSALLFRRPISLPYRSTLQNARRTLIAAPKRGDGPLMERRSDRELPIPEGSRLLKTFPIFLVILTITTLAFFNYQKSSSSVVTSSLYALRVNPEARAVLGDEIYFANKVPYIWGSIDQLHGRVDVWFKVKGTRGKGMMKFRCERKLRMGFFETLEWSLKMDDGQVLDLLRSESGVDPAAQVGA